MSPHLDNLRIYVGPLRSRSNHPRGRPRGGSFSRRVRRVVKRDTRAGSRCSPSETTAEQPSSYDGDVGSRPHKYISPPLSTNSRDFSAMPDWAPSPYFARISSVIFIEQNFGPHMEQKWAVLAPSCGRVSSWNSRARSGSRLRLN